MGVFSLGIFVKENHIGSAVNEILCIKKTQTQKQDNEIFSVSGSRYIPRALTITINVTRLTF